VICPLQDAANQHACRLVEILELSLLRAFRDMREGKWLEAYLEAMGATGAHTSAMRIPLLACVVCKLVRSGRALGPGLMNTCSPPGDGMRQITNEGARAVLR
jgi:hypothetical protein